MSYEKIDNAIWNIQLYMMKKYGCDAAETDIAPLKWYVNTGRASLDFLHSLISTKPFIIARKLHNAPSFDTAVNNLKTYFNAKEA